MAEAGKLDHCNSRSRGGVRARLACAAFLKVYGIEERRRLTADGCSRPVVQGKGCCVCCGQDVAWNRADG